MITGFVGQISLAQMAFAGISAFIGVEALVRARVAVPVADPRRARSSRWSSGLLVALPALRVRGVNLAIVTFAFAVAVDDIVFQNNSVNGGFNGALGEGAELDRPEQAGKLPLPRLTAGDGLQPNPMTAIFCLVVVVVAVLPGREPAAVDDRAARCWRCARTSARPRPRPA